jgi:putative nucleotidyltransferase with HDIG domain
MLKGFFSPPRQIDSKNRRPLLNTVGVAILAVLVLTSGLGYRFYNQPKLDVGTIAPQTIVAPASARVQDVKTTEAKREEARRNALPGMAVDRQANQQMQQNLQQILASGHRFRQILGLFPFTKTSILSTGTQIYLRSCTEEAWQAVRQRAANLPLPRTTASTPFTPSQQRAANELQAYRQASSPQKLSKLLETITQARQRYALALAALSAETPSPYKATFLNLSDSDWQATQAGVSQALGRMLAQGIYPGLSHADLTQAIEIQIDRSVPSAAKPLASQFLSDVLIPNLVIDAKQTRLMAERAAQAIAPEIVAIEKGKVIVPAGETITQADFVLLDHFHLSQRGIDWLALLAFAGLTGLAVGILGLVERRVHLKLRRRDYLLLLLLCLISPLAVIFTRSFTGLPAIGLLVGSFYGSAIGVTVMGLLVILLPVGTEVSWRYLLPSAAGGWLGSLMAGRWQFSRREGPRSREELAIVGVWVGIAQGVAYLLVNAARVPLEDNLLAGAALNGLTGFAWSIMALGLSPYLEHLFDLTTPIRLAELANPNRPLLKRLAQEAPGTFQHTLFVATLAESAARGLGCNVELVRTGVLYHDIGKLHDPLAFIENQMGGPNKHDAINDPWQSAEIVKKHVSEGLVMARQYRLPSAIQAFIPEHQGTILIAYFYHQAQQRVQPGDPLSVRESDFRYSGPIPQSRETGIVMLADACEAALRSLEEATPEEALAMVNKILKARWQDRQLVDSGLKREEMPKIAQIFVRVWQQFHHRRIAYPNPASR